MAPSLKPSHADAVEAIYAAGANPSLWAKTFGTLSDYLGVSGGMLAYHLVDTRTGGLITGRLRDDLTRSYLKNYTNNPYSLAAMKAPPGLPVVAGKLVDPAEVRRSAFHADILAPQNIKEMIIVPHPQLVSRKTTGGFSFTLNGAQAQDRERIRGRVATLAPHLVRAVDLTIATTMHSPEARQASEFLNVLPNAAILLDCHLRILQANAAAEALLAECDGLMAVREDGGLHLAARTSTEMRSLRAALVSAVAVAEGNDRGLQGALRVSCVSRRRTSLMVVVTPIPPPAFPLWAGAGPGARALVQIIDPHAPAEGQARVLQHAVDLTPTEARVAALIAEGATTPKVAELLGLSPSTVRTHLSRCFDKTGARSQVALVRLIASIPVTV